MGLEHLVPIKQYVPTIYNEVDEMDALCKSEDYLWNSHLITILDTESKRQTIQTSDVEGVTRKEAIMKITPIPSETLQFRKERLLTRCNTTLPYSTIWLRNYLNTVLGENNYELEIDYDDLIIKLYGFILDYNWSREASQVIAEAKPCNMIFMNIPTLIENLCYAPWFDDDTWEGTTWDDTNIWNELKILTKTELPDYDKETDGVNLGVLNNDITAIRLNNTETVTALTRQVIDHTLYITISVPNTITTLTKAEVLDTNSTPLITVNTQIDTPAGTQMTFRLSTWKLKEI